MNRADAVARSDALVPETDEEPEVTQTTADIEQHLVLEAIFRRHHFDFRGYSASSMARRLERARQEFGCATLTELQGRILHQPELLPRLLDILTVQVSELFRDPSYFRAIRETVVPHLRTYPSVKIWIAGCASGEEVYSLAILLREEGLEGKAVIYATDINPVALHRAEAGVYDLERVVQFTQSHRASGGKSSLSDYYTAGYGRMVFDKSLRDRVVFTSHNLANDEVFSEIHFVSCRNVLIYFDRPLQDRALGLFRDALVHGGFLGLGPRETLRFSRWSQAFIDFAPSERIYRHRMSADAAREVAHVLA